MPPNRAVAVSERRVSARTRWSIVLATFVVVLVLGAVLRLALTPPTPPLTPAQRVHALAAQLACPICEGLSVADSPSTLAGQMRTLIGQQVAEGSSDDQIRQYFVARYGPGILLVPPRSGFGWLAWWVPVIIIAISAGGIVLAGIRWTLHGSSGTEREVLPSLTAEEVTRYGAILEQRLSEQEEDAVHDHDSSQRRRDASAGAAAAPSGRLLNGDGLSIESGKTA